MKYKKNTGLNVVILYFNCESVCVSVCVRVCVCARVRVCVCVWGGGVNHIVILEDSFQIIQASMISLLFISAIHNLKNNLKI